MGDRPSLEARALDCVRLNTVPTRAALASCVWPCGVSSEKQAHSAPVPQAQPASVPLGWGGGVSVLRLASQAGEQGDFGLDLNNGGPRGAWQRAGGAGQGPRAAEGPPSLMADSLLAPHRPSPVLLSFGIPLDVARNAIRLSVGRSTTRAEVDLVVQDLKQAVARLEGQA